MGTSARAAAAGICAEAAETLLATRAGLVVPFASISADGLAVGAISFIMIGVFGMAGATAYDRLLGTERNLGMGAMASQPICTAGARVLQR